MFSKKEEIKVRVEGMSCGHCAAKVTNALEKIDGVKKVKVDLEKKQVTILSNKELEENIIKETIENLDYTYLGIVED